MASEPFRALPASVRSRLPLFLLCPRALSSTTADGEQGTNHIWYGAEDEPSVHNIAFLSGLSGLTRLDLNLEGRKISDHYWRALARLTDLKSLDMMYAHYNYLGGVAKLTACQQLTYLRVDDDESWPGFELRVSCACVHWTQMGCWGYAVRVAVQVPCACVRVYTVCDLHVSPHTPTWPWPARVCRLLAVQLLQCGVACSRSCSRILLLCVTAATAATDRLLLLPADA
jgi:hypothetical protein